MTRTKIVCTIGPASSSPERIEGLIEAGMDVARLNFSHGSLEDHGRTIEIIREAAARAGRPVAILQDLAGPKIRIGPIEEGPVLLETGATFTLTARVVVGNAERVSVSYRGLPGDVRVGDPLLLADGAIELAVLRVDGDEILCRVVVGGPLTSRKGINLPTRTIQAPILTAKDLEDLAFGAERNVDYVALSFVRNREDVEIARAALRKTGASIPLIAKIEKHEAVDRFDEILPVVNGVMIARGDLGVEIPIERVPEVQKRLIGRSNRAGAPVITATQMLRSMVENPRPTRAEVTDVANAILDGTDAVMLSEETAVGRYPVEAVRMMKRIAVETERMFPHKEWMLRFDRRGTMTPEEAVAIGACQMAEKVRACAIVTHTVSGSTTRLVARYRPRHPILALTPDESTWRRLALVWGVIPKRVDGGNTESDLVASTLEQVRNAGFAKPGQAVVITAGMPLYEPGTTNWIRVATL
ncbi:MAG: pyruvate kinase [Candidatus Eisenbacteria bacterium]|nr:pyruvate kinase [Candidatus Eisenbacteria bacterium]